MNDEVFNDMVEGASTICRLTCIHVVTRKSNLKDDKWPHGQQKTVNEALYTRAARTQI